MECVLSLTPAHNVWRDTEQSAASADTGAQVWPPEIRHQHWTQLHSQLPTLGSQGHGLMRHEYVINSAPAHQENVLETQSITADNLLRKTFICHCLLHAY